MSVIRIHHPTSERIELFVKASLSDDGVGIHWAHVDEKQDNGRWKREWIDLNKHPADGRTDGIGFWRLIEMKGFDPEEARIEMAEWLTQDRRTIL